MIRILIILFFFLFTSCDINSRKQVPKIDINRFQLTDMRWDLESLSSPPAFSWIDSTSAIRSLVYESVPFNGAPTKVFAYYSNPDQLMERKSKKSFPGVVLIHGGGGKAFKEWVEKWASDGYAAIAMDMGDWLKLNGEAIYGTQASPFPFLSWGRATRKGQTLYLHVFDWPKDGKLIVPLTNKISKAYLLADANTALKVTSGKANTVIKLPVYAPDKIASVIAIQFEGEPAVLSVPSKGKKVSVSSSEVKNMETNLTDGEPKTAWKAEKGEKTATLEIDLEKPATVQCLSLIEPWHPWSGIRQKHELYYLEGSEWIIIFKGETDGTGLTKSFAPVKAQKFRLILHNENEVPSLNELILFRTE